MKLYRVRHAYFFGGFFYPKLSDGVDTEENWSKKDKGDSYEDWRVFSEDFRLTVIFLKATKSVKLHGTTSDPKIQRIVYFIDFSKKYHVSHAL